nr:non capsid protein NS 1 [Hymenolepis microstoma]CUU98331.1 non capsid protein NS 1 [Hymenolepis microstoma]
MNTLCFKVQTNTGKTLLANLITSHLTLGTVCRRGYQTAFHFDNLVNRTVALMEELRITMITRNDYKCLLGGGRFESHVKYGARRVCNVFRAALYSGVKQHTLNEPSAMGCPPVLCPLANQTAPGGWRGRRSGREERTTE